MNITPELWRTVEPLLGTAIEMDAATRTTWLLDIDRAQPEVAPLLRKLLVAHERAERSGELDTVPPLLPRAGSSSAYSEAQRIGPFALLRALGHGGMGEVWLARQADGRVERNVALKLPAIHLQGETWRERFRRERDILARLEHPHIARLYDAGVTDAGQPWLAMEFVEGLSLTDHVRARALSMLQCLGLFRQVLAAVAHAHRHLVVHRDLKPANILIDAAGQVKLLDFGIAKLVDEGQSGTAAQDLTRVGGRMMTLRYAAPEQVAAGAITTATDVYALGVILHEMMTGLSPYRAVRERKAFTDVMLLQEEVAVPSGLAIPKPLARSLSGDLDAIVLKALRRDPVERYASVERFDEDIRAYLEKRPVKARAGTWRYLAGRFVVRHKLPLAMATAVLATLAAGLVMVDQQRRVAVAERARAEKHFASVRKLANTFIVDVHAEIENLAGSLKAREMLIGTSLEYLNALAGEAGSDPALQHELAVAYMNVANIQGQPTNANRGNFVAATGNYEKARDLLVAADAARPGQATLLRDLARLRYSLARSYFTVSDPRWQPELVATIELAGRVAALPAATRSDRAFVALALSEKAHMTSLMSGLTPEVEAALKQAVAIQEALVREAPGEFTLRETLVRLYMRAASGLAHTGHSERSLRESTGYAITARDLARALSAERPSDSTLQARVYVATLDLAMVYSLAGRHREADANIEEAIAFTTRLSAGDPENITRVHDRVYSLSQGALIAYRLGDGARAVARGREAVAIVATWSTEALMSRDVQARVAEANMYLGLALLVASDSAPRARRAALLREARPLIAGGVAFIADFRARKIGSVPEEHFQEMSQALARCDEAIARLG